MSRARKIPKINPKHDYLISTFEDRIALSSCHTRMLISHIELTQSSIKFYYNRAKTFEINGLIKAAKSIKELSIDTKLTKAHDIEELKKLDCMIVTFKNSNRVGLENNAELIKFLDFIIQYQNDLALRDSHHPKYSSSNLDTGYYFIRQMLASVLTPSDKYVSFDSKTPFITPTAKNLLLAKLKASSEQHNKQRPVAHEFIMNTGLIAHALQVEGPKENVLNTHPTMYSECPLLADTLNRAQTFDNRLLTAPLIFLGLFALTFLPNLVGNRARREINNQQVQGPANPVVNVRRIEVRRR